MATYRQISEYVKREHGFSPKTCWIAHVLFDLGLTARQAPNRLDPNSRKHPCPSSKRPAIEAALLHFNLVSAGKLSSLDADE
jgi:hypothetical protein